LGAVGPPEMDLPECVEDTRDGTFSQRYFDGLHRRRFLCGYHPVRDT
jgi:hypothetical protein